MITRDEFFNWQCRIRQIAMREDEGMPSSGMQPSVRLGGGLVIMPAMNLLLVRKNSEESTAFFKFQVQKSNDPKEIKDKGLQFLQSTFFHNAQGFSDDLTAVFSPSSLVAEQLLQEGTCLLTFEQFNQTFKLVCRISLVDPTHDYWTASFWQAALFNPSIPGDVQILAFTPVWEKCEADFGG